MEIFALPQKALLPAARNQISSDFTVSPGPSAHRETKR
jgi:hypothetical protein